MTTKYDSFDSAKFGDAFIQSRLDVRTGPAVPLIVIVGPRLVKSPDAIEVIHGGLASGSTFGAVDSIGEAETYDNLAFWDEDLARWIAASEATGLTDVLLFIHVRVSFTANMTIVNDETAFKMLFQYNVPGIDDYFRRSPVPHLLQFRVGANLDGGDITITNNRLISTRQRRFVTVQEWERAAEVPMHPSATRLYVMFVHNFYRCFLNEPGWGQISQPHTDPLAVLTHNIATLISFKYSPALPISVLPTDYRWLRSASAVLESVND